MTEKQETGKSPEQHAEDMEQLNKWRLMLGKNAAGQISFQEGETAGLRYMEMEDVLDFLYNREYGEEQGIRRERQGGREGSRLTVTSWIQQIRKLFPKQTVEIMEKHALEHYGMTELLTDPEVLEKLEPNQELLKTILELKHLMKGDVLETARRIVKTVADQLTEKLQKDIRRSILGRVDQLNSSPVKTARNLDIKKTITRNLKHYDREKRRLVLEQVYFHGRIRHYHKWRIIICVDESGSMLDSVIHSAVMAGIFARLPVIDTRLVIFDTNVVDLSGYVDDPVEALMSIQLGGGTNIAGALAYCEKLIETPRRTIVVLISDLYEGMGYQNLYSVSRGIIESGARLIALTALDMNANPNYDREAAARLADLGASVAAMTPEQLADWIGKVME